MLKIEVIKKTIDYFWNDRKIKETTTHDLLFNIFCTKVYVHSVPYCTYIVCIVHFQSWALSVIFKFVNNKTFFCIFIKLIWLGVGFLNRTGEEIGYWFEKNAIKSFFITEKIKKYRKCPALVFPYSPHFSINCTKL